jgi:hypothetical protein
LKVTTLSSSIGWIESIIGARESPSHLALAEGNGSRSLANRVHDALIVAG